jgi:hypothetical protein
MKRVVGALALIALLAPAIAGARSTGTLRMSAFFSSPSLPTSCQPDASEGTSCSALRASASVRGLGNARLEAIQATTDPGFHVRVSGRLIVSNRGSLEFEADNSQTSRDIVLALRITGGTGVFAGASGSGTYQIDGRTNTTSLWDVVLSAPDHEFDVQGPRLVVSSIRVSVSAGVSRVSSSKPSGVLQMTIRRAPRVRVSLLAADTSANTARRSVIVRC